MNTNTNTAHELAIYDAAINYADARATAASLWISNYATADERTAADAATTAAHRALLETLDDETVTTITHRYITEAGR